MFKPGGRRGTPVNGIQMQYTNDLSIAVRSLKRQWRSSAVIILTLALGVGATGVIFSFMLAILLEPLPFADGEELVRIHSLRSGETGPISLAEVEDLKARTDIFADIAVHGQGLGGYNLSGDGKPEEIPAVLCSRNLFSVLGVKLALGTTWPEEGDRLRNHSVVLGHDLWERRWGESPEAVQNILTLDGAELYRVYGVAPQGLQYPWSQSLYRSIAFIDLDYDDRSARRYVGLARLREGVTYAQAVGELRRVAADLSREFPDSNAEVDFGMVPLGEHYSAPARPYLLLVMCAAAFVLAIAFANVVNILLVRAVGEARNTAIRTALGAGSWRVFRLWAAQGLMLGLVGGLAALLLAAFGVRFLRELLTGQLPGWVEISLNGPAMALTLVAACLCGMAAAILPARQAARIDLADSLAGGNRASTGGPAGPFTRRLLVTGQIAVTVVLLIGAGLMARTLQKLLAEDSGFRRENALMFRVNLGWRSYPPGEKRINYFKQMLDGLQSLSGVTGAATISNPPLAGISDRMTVTVEGQSALEHQRNPFVNRKYVSPGYFELAGVPLHRGRLFDERDRLDAPIVAVVSRRTSQALWPGENPLGKRFKFESPDSDWPWFEVIGVAGNVQQESLGGETGLDVYLSHFQYANLNAYFMLRTPLDPWSLAKAADRLALSIDPNQSTWEYATMEGLVDQNLWRQRLAGVLVVSFAVLAALVAAVGIYGLIEYDVRRRWREIGIRLALGADQGSIRNRVLRQSATLCIFGLLAGLPLALAMGISIRSFLFKVEAVDPISYASAALAILAVAAASAWFPARRASQVNPIRALKED